jgi:hypothetical protein
MAKTPNISRCQRERAQRVRTRREHSCICCNDPIPKGIQAKAVYVNGLGRVLSHTHHRTEDLILQLWSLIGAI